MAAPIRVVRLDAAAAGPTISVKTSSTPTICAHSDVAMATIAMKAAERNRSGTPRASASSGWSEAKVSGLAIAPRAMRLAAARIARVKSAAGSTPSTLPNRSAAACVAAEV